MNFKLTALLAAAALFSPLAHAQTVPPGTEIREASFSASTATPTVAEASDFTAVADSGGSLSAKTFRFYDPNGVCYQPWYDVDNGSTAPAAATGCTRVEVDIATGDTDSTVAGNTRTALNTAPYTTYFTITGSTTHIIVTSVLKGSATDGNIGDTGFSVSKTQGVSGSAAATAIAGGLGYRICNAAVNTSTWLAVGEGTDPETDGVRLAKGQCLDCPSCTPASLTALKVSAQAASNAYAVVQFKK
jgi:hypothetical protein